ncbi:MAG: bifunctional transaldolase/phosoglucose isomerase [Candidatus Melainabacteria bacterium]|nr:bifunctional transaldolase/phosoglucose isomerase [Candidatus Melainabacteria bacterium]
MTTTKQETNRLKQLNKQGQSIWLDFIRRSFVRSGDLRKLVDEDGLRGVTSNPSIFEKAIGGSDDYKDQILELSQDRSLDANGIYERLAIQDIQEACDVLKGVYEETAGRDGYVSMEVSPLLASDTEATVSEALRLWKAVDRANLMVKVPGTPEGIPAVKRLIAEGLNINVTLLFATDAYKEVAEAYISGLEECLEKGGKDLGGIASVASFFVSRIDGLIDSLLKDKIKVSDDEREKTRFQALLGKAAIANAKMAYQFYREIYTSERWKTLASHGARPQRLLWASTSTKDPSYKDCLYVDELIGNETVNTLPLPTLEAFRDHGIPEETLEKRLDESTNVLEQLERYEISMKEVTDKLLEEGVESFAVAFKKLLGAVDKERKSHLPAKIDTMSFKLPAELSKEVESAAAEWQKEGNTEKLWNKDASLWTGDDEDKWMEWLDIVDEQIKQADKFDHLAAEVKESGFEAAVVLGMGGSSLCPEVMSMTFTRGKDFPELTILDSTNPEQILAKTKLLNLKETLFIVSSKSGSTLEPNIFMEYFLNLVKEEVGEDKVGYHFIAVTDPNSKLEAFAKQEGFREIYYGKPSIGGRYSALSDFGMIPSAVMGLDVREFLNRTSDMVEACKKTDSVEENPGVMLGIILGTAAVHGFDKLTIFTSSSISDVGAWLEQLIAESTGKEGKSIIPLDRELLGSPHAYGSDRIFVYLSVAGEADKMQEEALTSLEGNGHPVIRITLEDKMALGEEFFRWEIATAVAGSILGINPFNQPDVEASKIATKALTEAYEKTGVLPAEKPFFEDHSLKFFTDERNLKDFDIAEKKLSAVIKSHLDRIGEGDYFAVLAYLHMNEENERMLQNIRHAVRDSRKVATCLGFGPRFLHSTGQAYKGGPNSGVFLQITSDHEEDVAVPGHKYSFGIVVDAQAQGDLTVLSERERRLLRVHLTGNVQEALKVLTRAVAESLS